MMGNVDLMTVLVLAGYVAFQLGIAWWVGRKVKTEADYLLAGRNLGIVLVTFSLFATWFGAETMVASSGAIAADGLSGGRAEPFGYALCMVLFGLLIAYRIRDKGFTTLSDFYRQRFGKATEKLSVALIVPTSLIWAAAQALAFGYILAGLLGLPVETALLIGMFFLTLYTVLGGFLGDIIHDFVQGIILIVGLILTAGFLVMHQGGLDAVLSQIDVSRLNIVDPDTSLWIQSDEWAIAIVGSLQSQEIISRMLAAKSPQVARRSCFAAAAMYFLVGLVPAFIGLAGANVIAAGEDTDAFLPALAKEVLPPFIHVMFLGALLAAILSTIDSTLLAIAALVGHNVVLPLRPAMSEGGKVLMQRVIVIMAAVLTYLVASSGENVYGLIEISSSFGSAGLVVCVVFGLWSRFGSARAALVTLVSGAVLAYVFQYNLEWEAGYIASLISSIVIYTAVALIEKTIGARGNYAHA